MGSSLSGRGRPKTKPESKMVSFRLSLDTIELLKDLAQANNCAMSDVISKAVEQFKA